VFTTAAAVSFFLSGATAFLWGMTMAQDHALVRWRSHEHRYAILSGAGMLMLSDDTSAQAGAYWGGKTALSKQTTLLGVTVTTWALAGRYGMHVAVPHVYFSVIFCVLPLAWLLKTLRRVRRKGSGLCLHCGYDLRASRDRCPECGTAIS